MTDLGPCMSGFCNNDARVYVFGPTLGASPRLLVIAGTRAAQLADSPAGALNALCGDCAGQILDGMLAAAVEPRQT